MELPKFLVADNSSLQNVIFVIHTEYPRFIINITNDEEFLLSESEQIINEAFNFYDNEMGLI